MELRYSFFVVLFCTLLVTVLSKRTPGNASKKNDTCYKPCRVKSGPVCGNDGRNYSTGCHLSVAKCRARKFGQKIYLLKTGFCASSKPLSLCSLNCTARRQLVCGSDKVTYRNLCMFKKVKCEKRKNKEGIITVTNRKGPCVKIKSCRKFKTCPKVNRPVCGTDNKTYKNMCYLKTTNCVKKRKARGKKITETTMKHCGMCGRAKQCSSTSQPKCPSIKMCDQMLKTQRVFCKKGKTPRKSTKKGKGPTKRSSYLKGKKTKVSKKKRKGKKTKKTVLKGKRRFMVCGSNGKTYSSLCHLQVAQCNNRKIYQRLYLRRRGPCKRRRS